MRTNPEGTHAKSMPNRDTRRYFIWICRHCHMQTQSRSCPYCKAIDPPIPYTKNCDLTEVVVK